MNKKILFFSLLILAVSGVVFKSINSKDTEVDKLRNQHSEFLRNHPFQKTGELPKKERKALGLPPNAFFEQQHLSEINPSTGKTHEENILHLQEKLSKLRAGQKVPGEVDNPWIERGPDNVGGRTRGVLFDPNDATNETVFAGGVSGGLWKNTKISDANSKWTRIGIPENLAVSCIVADPNNPQILYVGTGESYTSGKVNGNGLWKSTDGGNSWTNVFGGVTGASSLDANTVLTVNSPSGIAGDYIAILTTAFGSSVTTPITNELVLIDDGTAPNDDGCTAATNGAALNGKIAVIRRGSCNFSVKAKNAQDAGAVAVLIINNVQTTIFNMAAGTTGGGVTVPSLMISKKDGDALINAMASGSVNATISVTNANAINGTIVPGVQQINDVVVRNNNGISEIYVAAGESIYATGASIGGDSFGVYKSVDGTNFSKLDIPKTEEGKEHEPNDLEIASDNSIYLSTTRSHTFGDGGGIIFKSTDGTTFAKVYTITDGLRTQIEVSPANANVVYVLAQIGTSGIPVRIFKTIDNFANVSELALPNDADNGIPSNDFTRGQGYYNLLLKVDPNNENTLYAGGIDLFKSTDGGTNWNQISKWSNNNNLAGLSISLVHADQHALAFSPSSSSRMVFGNDGGVYFSNDSGATINSRNKNYNTLQFYTIGVAPTTAFANKEYFLAGAQDNGTQLIKDASSGINSSTESQGGDGAASFFDTDGTDKYYIANYIYNQRINTYEINSGSNDTRKTVNRETTKNGDFINQEDLDSNLNILYSNYSSGTNYIVKRYSGLLGTITKDDLTNDLMDAEPSTLKVSPLTTTTSKLYVGLNNGKLLKIENANTGTGTWSDITGKDFIGSVSDIEFGVNENQIFVTMHNYGVVSIWYTNDGGSTWLNKEGNLPDIPVKTILQNPLIANEVIIGTNLGVWKTSDFNATSPTWVQAYNGMSYVPVLDLDLRDDNTVFAATYGRGVFSGKFVLDPNGDEDNDTILNGVDNCPTTANTDQKDTDGNGIGDVCQDIDKDGILDINDNCPTTANADQKDTDGNGVGDACQDTDSDSIMDDKDNCPTIANADQKDTNGNGSGDVCDTSYAKQDNITIQTVSETCVDQNDGKITVTIKEIYVAYKVTITGGKTETKEMAVGENTVTFEGLDPADYVVCVEVTDRSYKQCFEVKIIESAPISLRAAKNQSSKDYTITMKSGTAPYTAYLNGQLISTFNNSTFNVKVEKGGVLEVETSKKCEGKFSIVIDNVFLKENPVTDTIKLLMPNNADASTNVTVFDVTGKVILKDNIQRQGNELSIPFSSFKSGIYILKLGNDNINTFKILK